MQLRTKLPWNKNLDNIALLLEKSLWELMQAFPLRQAAVEDFVSEVKDTIRLEPVKIFDPFGPTITDPDLDCLVVSEETKGGGQAVNTERKKLVCFFLESICLKG